VRHNNIASDVGLASEADITSRQRHVRFTPQKRTFVVAVGMSALCQKLP
jgi:hypothetical protein